MERQLDQLCTLLPLLREIEQLLPPGSIPIDFTFKPSSGPGLIHDRPPHVERIRLSYVVVQEEHALVVGIVDRAYAPQDREAANKPPPGILIGTTDNPATPEGIADLVLPIFPDRGFAFGTVSPEDPRVLRVQLCWGPTDNRDVNHRGHMVGTPTPIPLRRAFDLPESFPVNDRVPERRMCTEAFVESCRTFILTTYGA